MKTLALFPFAAGCLAAVSASAANWPGWRNDGSGICSETSVPLRWNATNNILWKTALPERGNSSPIVWEDKVFLTQADGNRRMLMAFQRRDGKLLWQAGPVFNEPDPTHQANPFCSSTPVTDGERVIAWFGSAGLYCYDTKGTELWHRDLGKQTHEWGYGSSPVLYGDLCLLHFGPGKRTFLTALNKKTGETVWRIDTPEVEPTERFDGFAGKQGQPIGSWSTPLILKTAKRDEALLSSAGTLKSFDPKTGKELWKSDGLNPLIYASPIASEGMVVAMGGFFGSTVAIKQGGSGDLSRQNVWREQRAKKHRIGTGVIKDGYIYISNTVGVGECIELATGKTVWEERFQATGPSAETWSSLIMVGDRLYVVNQSGDTIVFRASPKFELIVTNSLGESSNSTIAISNGQVFLRTDKHLWCIGENPETAGRMEIPSAIANKL